MLLFLVSLPQSRPDSVIVPTVSLPQSRPDSAIV